MYIVIGHILVLGKNHYLPKRRFFSPSLNLSMECFPKINYLANINKKIFSKIMVLILIFFL